jgi:hypothetical protein
MLKTKIEKGKFNMHEKGNTPTQGPEDDEEEGS